MKKILIILTGGTLASVDTGAGLEPGLFAKDILSFLPKEFVEKSAYQIEAKQIFSIESSDLEHYHWIELSRCIKEAYEYYDGFVIVHGTDTLAYTSSALTYALQGLNKPVVVTGSQYPIGDAVTDALKNLIDSCNVAALSGLNGVYVVFDGKIILGNRVTKFNSKSVTAFKSINYPDVGMINGDELDIYINNNKTGEDLKVFENFNNNILLVKFYPGISAEKTLQNYDTYDGIIFECYGVAGIPKSFVAPIEKILAAKIPVIVSTQNLNEGTDLKRYTVGNYLHDKDYIVESKKMTLESTITKLMYALGRSKNAEECLAYFEEVIIPR